MGSRHALETAKIKRPLWTLVSMFLADSLKEENKNRPCGN